jgi:hypothetical protein
VPESNDRLIISVITGSRVSSKQLLRIFVGARGREREREGERDLYKGERRGHGWCSQARLKQEGIVRKEREREKERERGE